MKARSSVSVTAYRFGECELDRALYQLRIGGVPVGIEPKVFDVLVYLLEHRDRVVTKDELLGAPVPGDFHGIPDGQSRARRQ